MPSPFPGMDPFLEEPDRWESFHGCFISVMHELLQAQVRPHFLVTQEVAVYSESRTLLAERTITTPTLLAVRYPEEVRQRFLEVRDRANQKVVATIELVSPTNKDRRGKGLAQFDRKRRDVMASPVHWLEIDLLRAGERPPEVTGDVTRQSDYYALLKRGHAAATTPSPWLGETRYEVWFFNLRDPLPVVAVPLRPPFPDAALDLQTVLATVYERFYDGMVNYARPLASPLPPADAAWAAERVRAWQAG